jgi:hypothetical protein
MVDVVSVQLFETVNGTISAENMDLSGGDLALLFVGTCKQYREAPSLSIDNGWLPAFSQSIGTFLEQVGRFHIAAKESPTSDESFTITGTIFEVAILVLLDTGGAVFVAPGAQTLDANPNPPAASVLGDALAIAACATWKAQPTAGPAGWDNYTLVQSSFDGGIVNLAIATKAITGTIDPPPFSAQSATHIAATVLVH